MNTSIVKGNLLEIKGKAKSKLGSLLDNRSMYLSGKKDELLGKGLKGYGKVRRFFAA